MNPRSVTAFTLVDITPTDYIYIRDANKSEYHQMQNLQVLLQAIGMRTQCLNPVIERLDKQDLLEYSFDYDGVHSVWKLTFQYEYEYAWNDGSDELGLLKQDTHGVAFSSGLNNTVDFEDKFFDTLTKRNLYFGHTPDIEESPSDT